MTFYRRQRSRKAPRGVDTVASTITAEGTAVLCFPADGTFFRGQLTTKLEPSMSDDSPYAIYGRETPTPGVYKVTIADLETGSQYHLNSVQLRGKLRKTKEIPKPVIKSESIAIPIIKNNKIVLENSPDDFNDIFFANESCPNFHEFHHERREDIIEDDIIPDNIAGFEDSIRSSLSDIHENSPNSIDIPISESTASYSDSPNNTPNDMKETQTPQFSLDCEDEQNILQFTAESIYRGQKADMMIQQFMAGSKLSGSKCVVLKGPLRFSVNEIPLMSTGNMAWSM